MPLRWIQAMSFFARAPREAESWAARATPALSEEQLGQFRAGLDFVREQGFLPLMRRPDRGEEGIGAGTEDPPVVPQLSLDAGTVYPLMAVMAPIYDSRNRVTISLVMAGFHGAMTGEDRKSTRLNSS